MTLVFLSLSGTDGFDIVGTGEAQASSASGDLVVGSQELSAILIALAHLDKRKRNI